MTAVEAQILELYRHINNQAAKWGEHVPLIADAGFRILCGPPILGAPMVVSLNPGLTKKVRELDGHDFWPKRWPGEMSYARGISAFSRKLAVIFDGAGINLENVNACYVLAFRSKSLKEWKEMVPLDVRKDAQRISLDVLAELISVLRPSFIFAAGFSTLKRMGCTANRTEIGRRKSGAEFVVLRYSSISGVSVISSPHPSGSRLTRQNLDQISLGLRRTARS